MTINGVMTPEVQAAAKFISTCLYGKLPRRRADLFGQEFASAVTRKFQGHWYLDTPTKGSAYRCLHFTSKEVDPCFHQAADSAGVAFNELTDNVPAELRVWVDPGEVSYQIGEKGTVSILYRRNQLGQEEFGHDLVSHVEPVRTQQQTENQRLFTVAEFMSTKFGSMKNRGMRRNQMNPNGFRNPNLPQMPQQFNRLDQLAPQSPTARHQAGPMNPGQVHPQLLLQQQLLIQQLALQNLQLNPSSIEELQKIQGQQQQMGLHPLLGHNMPTRSNPLPHYQEHVPDLQLHLTSRGGLKPSFTFPKQPHHHEEPLSMPSSSPVRSSPFGFKDCWSSSSNRNSPHSDSNNHSGDDSGFDNASLDDDLDLDPLIFNQIASLRLET